MDCCEWSVDARAGIDQETGYEDGLFLEQHQQELVLRRVSFIKKG